ncbi:hypothetical protein EST38_g6465 [Candolleomyces aberdarensis]|uniref:F-box protein n=1 Tax=Candolleomyces aberdarensis TaxID=2316362 RepID=A0A4Q2DKK0_9AGAR|nr:hypothetical protein EST38_g6465 [Candolleomyces aberdarensis]
MNQLVAPIGSVLACLLLKDVTFDDLSLLSSFSFPSLEQLVISLDERAGAPENDSASIANLNAPALRRVSFSGAFVEEIDHGVLFPWKQLTHFLCYNNPDYCDFFLLTHLPFCIQLNFLHFELQDGEREQDHLEDLRDTTANRIVLPNLETLSLDFGNLFLSDYEDRYLNMFLRFELPNLQKLYLSFGSTDGEIIPAFLDELRRLKNLEHLSLAIHGNDAETLARDMLQALPSIKTLELSLAAEYTGFLESLIPSGQQGFLPNLLTLALMFDESILDHDRAFLDPGILAQFVDSRTQCDLAIRLEKITIFVCHPEGSDYSTLNAVQEVLRPYTPEVLVWNVRYKAVPWRRWIYIDPELDDKPELLDLY